MTQQVLEVADPQVTTDPVELQARGWWRVWRSPAGQPRWARPVLLLIAAAAGVVYAWGVGRMQLHLYYGPGVQSMAGSWAAWASAAYDPKLTITFDKLPGTFWLQALSARLFGYEPWAVLLPSLLASVGAILALYRIVSRWAGPSAALIAAACYATTPIVAALARTQIPDAVLVLVLLLAAGAWQTAVLTGRLGPLLACGLWIGAAFHVKMAQAWLLWLPLGLTYLMFAVLPWGSRVGRLLLAGATTLAVSAAWIAAMTFTPASSRPWIDGSVDNSVLSMVFGYNGFNRYGVDNAGAEILGVGGPLGRAEGSGWLYLFRDGVAPQVGWLYPLALAGLIAGRWAVRACGRTTDRALPSVRSTYVMWALWLAAHTIVFALSLKAHSFYNIVLGPPLAAFAGVGATFLWTRYRAGGRQRWLLPVTVAATAGWAVYLGGRFPTFAPSLNTTITITGVVAVAGLLAVATLRPASNVSYRAAAVVAAAAVMLAPLTWTLSVTDNRTVSDAHRPAAGPASRETASILSGRLQRMIPAADIDQLASYLTANNAGQRYQVAVQWSPQAGQFQLRGITPLPIGGFTAQVPNVSPQQLDELTRDGQLRYALLDGPATKGKPTPDYPGYATWVRQHCAVIDAFDKPAYILYDCR
ncbi:mannosyl transferase [Micromonospora sp. KC207]|uniref:ArnT family glycosyltransferase n=1 Tax=Micromonospora sp. KC207 TaxID=2530377 RepID=UPI0010510EAA|nr:glycosyltransferase family 39 protein [Micromonospora sp. KC207]TDC65972.1 mannosyl transferase [Micromonospora sp. KC207]